MPEISIQYQNANGYWTTVQQVMNDPHYIANGLRSAKSMYPAFRVRAVDQSGRLVDIL